MMISKYLHFYFRLTVFSLLLPVVATAADIQVAVDRNPVNLNESFKIIFTAYETPDGNPDFAPLAVNFEILNQQRSSNASWVNGKSSRTEQWIVNVMAKQAGELLIPPIGFGADTSKPMKISVTDRPQAAQSNDEIFLEVEATPEKPYVQSQVLYTLKLYRRIQIAQASLNEPDIKDALVEKLGEDSTYTTQVNGMDYWVTERKYAIFPQQSGLITLAPLTLTAEVVTTQQPRFNGFFNRQITETRRVSSKAITLNVQPVPPGFTGSVWLGADALELQESWSDRNLQSQIGEPLTRTITLSVKGATVGQLPELATQTNIDGIKTYPDQPVLKEDKQSDGLTAVREEKIAYIPGKPGEYTVPALEIQWFNNKTGKMETARLPARTITALPVAGSQTSTPPATNIPAAPHSDAMQTTAGQTQPDIRIWQGLAAFLALGWLLTAIGLYRRVPRQSPPPKPVAVKPANNAEKSLKIACAENNPQTAKQALLQWGAVNYAIDNLGALAARCDTPLRDEILLLNRCLYSGQSEAWNGRELWQAFSRQDTPVLQEQPQNDGLQPLHRL